MMTPAERTHILSLLDSERQTVVYPGVLRFTEGALVRDVSLDGKICEVIYARATEEDVDRMVKREVRAGRDPGQLDAEVFGRRHLPGQRPRRPRSEIPGVEDQRATDVPVVVG